MGMSVMSGGIEAVIGKGIASSDAGSGGADAAQSDPAFANLMQDMGGASAAASAGNDTAAISGGIPEDPMAGLLSDSTALSDDAEGDAALQPDVAADLLALLSNPLVPQPQSPAPALIGRESEIVSSLDEKAATAMVAGKLSLSESQNSSAAGDDMQWLQAAGQKMLGTTANNSTAKPESASHVDSTEGLSNLLQAADDAKVSTPGAFQAMLGQLSSMGVRSQLKARDELEQVGLPQGDQSNAVNMLGAAALNVRGAQQAGEVYAPDGQQHIQLNSQVGSHHWATELGNKLTMLASKESRSATLYMTPADLGPVQVKIQMDQSQASVWFTAEHPETRSALEQSLPRLREMFTAQGMSLTDAGVFGDRSRQQSSQTRSSSGFFSGEQEMKDEFMEQSPVLHRVSLSMLDAYA